MQDEAPEPGENVPAAQFVQAVRVEFLKVPIGQDVQLLDPDEVKPSAHGRQTRPPLKGEKVLAWHETQAVDAEFGTELAPQGEQEDKPGTEEK